MILQKNLSFETFGRFCNLNVTFKSKFISQFSIETLVLTLQKKQTLESQQILQQDCMLNSTTSVLYS